MKKLDDQRNRKKVEIQIGDKLQKVKNPYRDKPNALSFRLAEQLYDDIRKSDEDINNIAKNIKLKPENIKKVKDYIFYDIHKLSKYGENEIEYKRFDPSLTQGLAWRRLQTGTFIPEDITYLKHEFLDKCFALKHDRGYAAAHEKAQKMFDEKPQEKYPDDQIILFQQLNPFGIEQVDQQKRNLRKVMYLK